MTYYPRNHVKPYYRQHFIYKPKLKYPNLEFITLCLFLAFLAALAAKLATNQ